MATDEKMGEGDRRECVFPFKYKGKTYEKCTEDHHDVGHPWCAYEVDSDGELGRWPRKWAYCGREERCLGGEYRKQGRNMVVKYQFEMQTLRIQIYMYTHI